jgi:hypothetical protein
MTISDCIQLGILLVGSFYTFATYRLLSQQKKQFVRSNRPWVHASDILYHKRLVLPELGVLLLNSGKLPAMCNVYITRLSVKHPFADEISLIGKDEIRNLPILPFVDGTDSAHMFLFVLTEEQSLLFSEGVKVECDIRIQYTLLDDKAQKTPYRYEANLLVERFSENVNKQSTLIKVSEAT